MKTLLWTGAIIGSTLGSYLPVLWGGSVFSITSILLSGLFGILGVIAGIKLANYWGID